MKIRILLICLIISVQPLRIFSDAHAGNLGMGVHSGYGVIKYEEQTAVFGFNRESESTQNAVIFGASGEYSFPRHENFYAGVTTDWVLGLKGDERLSDNNIQFQTNDMGVFGQFYDLRLGYKNSLNNFYYRTYASGGWDGLHFKRSNFVVRSVSVSGTGTEDFSLWRAGAGLGIGYKAGEWALDGRAAYSYYPKGSVNNSSYPGITFDTNGTCFDMGAGIARGITPNVKFYAGVSYTLLELGQSDVIRSGSRLVVFPDSTTEMLFGVVNLTYVF